MRTFITILSVLAATILISMLVDRLRPRPSRPERLSWAPDLEPQYVEVASHRLRYVKVGRGPNLVLLHTLRTQLDIFHKVLNHCRRDSQSMPWIIRGTVGRLSLTWNTAPTPS